MNICSRERVTLHTEVNRGEKVRKTVSNKRCKTSSKKGNPTFIGLLYEVLHVLLK